MTLEHKTAGTPMDWLQVLVIVGSNFAMLGSVIALHINQANRIDENRRETNVIINEIKDEMKDFHKRLLEIEMARKNGP